ncbi:putative nuclease HARBI1 [Ruditapes philippinarum]|uniref:putative nuclease HARBI1 n=1 Tax=Ruditapes philippinarum TaxID=129788 RepID=UPI00295BE395|nr:putative nuclease HARBI1 [Ruditapes philippinarum]
MAEHTALLSILVEEIAEDTLMERIQSNISVASDSIHVGSSAALSLVRDMIRDPVRVEGYVPDVVNHYSDIEFKSHFRMKRSTFEQLCTDVAPYMRRERTMKLETKMLATLWMLGNLECYRSVADRFGISKGTLHLTVISTCKAISSLKTDYIKFPENRTEMDAIAEGFHKRCGMPGVVGAIDGTHIPVPAPTSEHRASFINRKGFSSIQLQVVCDSNLKLLDTYTGWPGSVHDARVYRNSPADLFLSVQPICTSVTHGLRCCRHLHLLKETKTSHCC